MDDAQALAIKHYAALNARDFVAYGEHLADDVTMVSDAGVTVGREASVAMARALTQQFPRMMVEVERMTVAPGSVICELRLEGLVETDDDGVERSAPNPGQLSQILDVRDGRVVALRTYRSPVPAIPSTAGQLQAHGQALGLTNEQAALRHVAVLAAGGASLEAILAAAVLEASALLGGTSTTLLRYDEAEGSVTVVARTNSGELGHRFPIEQDAVAASVRRSGSAQRADDDRRTTVGVPIAFESRLWGILTATSTGQALPAGAMRRLTDFVQIIESALVERSDAR